MSISVQIAEAPGSAAGLAVVTEVKEHPASRRKPTPMNSVDFAQAASHHLKIASARAAEVRTRVYYGPNTYTTPCTLLADS
jgi:DNA topoisomerase IA